MLKQTLSLGAVCAMSLCLADSKPCTDPASRPIWVSARYTSPEGVGYKPGYTTLQGFFSKQGTHGWIPFLDLRGHVFDDGQLAGNAGFGLRWITCSRIWGANAYYDYRNTSHQHYNQVSAGLEMLGINWDFRLNGYLPVGAKESSLRHNHFDRFQGHYMYVRGKRDFALKGGNAELGYHFEKIPSVPLYFAAGPYYLTGKGATAWGGEFRAAADFFHQHLRIEGNVSYDHFFRWIGQGQVSLNFSIGGKKKRQCSCSQPNLLYARSTQRVDRNEIIPIGTQHVSKKAINPATHTPYYFVFVDNTSSSLGTYESPYPSLTTAQALSGPGQILYLFPGNGTSSNMDTGITLQNNQMLLGAGTVQILPTSVGNIAIPALSGTSPVITNTASAPVVTLANGNTVSGIYIENNNGSGIFGHAITDFIAAHNTIIGGAAGEGILLEEISGQLTVNDNFIVQTGPMASQNYAVHVVSSSASCNATFNRDQFYLHSNGNGVSGIFFDLNGSAFVNNLIVTNTSINGATSAGAGIHTSMQGDSAVANLTVTGCQIANLFYGVEMEVLGAGSMQNVLVSQSSLVNFGYTGVYVDLESTGVINQIQVADSLIRDAVSYGIVTYQGGPSAVGTLSCTNTTFTNCLYGINPELGGTGALSNLNVSGCSFYQNTFAIQIDLQNAGPVTYAEVSNCTFNNNGGTGININFAPGTFISDFNLLQNEIIASEYGMLTSLNGEITTLNIQSNSFKNNLYALSLQNNATPELNISQNVFSGNGVGIASNAIPATQRGVISNNQFLGNTSGALIINPLAGSTNSFSVFNNEFTGTGNAPIQGYGTLVTTSAGSSLCLDFFNNRTTPTIEGLMVPYFFDATTGTFNLTAESTQANNTGTLLQTGSFGSCTP